MTNIKKLTRMSQLFQPSNFLISKSTLAKQENVSKSYKHFLQNGVIRPVSSGMYAFLPLGLRVLDKITAIVDAEMANIGAQKILLPALTSSGLWKTTDRYKDAKPELFVLEDRHNKEFILSPTHEEGITKLISELGLLSPTIMPLKLYQISSKWRDEMKARIGFLRSREFIMKDLYTFDINIDNAKQTYDLVCEAYDRIFKHIGINFVKVIGEAGNIGGDLSHEYHYSCDIGEDVVLTCSSCHYSTKLISGETDCPQCQKTLTKHKTTEVGHAFLLGTKYSAILKALYSCGQSSTPLEMGCYGLGISRIITAAVEQLSTESEMRWPKCLAPYTVCLIPPKRGSKEESASQFVEIICNLLQPLDIDMIIDDRTTMTIGKRFIHAKQVGYPYVIVIGKQAMESIPLIEVHNIYNSTCVKMTITELTNYFSLADDKPGEMTNAQNSSF